MSDQNTEGLAGQMPTGGSGEFMPSKPGSEPLESSGHQPGKLVGNDAAPEFHAQTLPAGTAPPDRTFKPNNDDEVPPEQGDGADPEVQQPSAGDTIGGATSADVHKGLGHPGSGQTSAEVRHEGEHHRKNPGSGLEGIAATKEGK